MSITAGVGVDAFDEEEGWQRIGIGEEDQPLVEASLDDQDAALAAMPQLLARVRAISPSIAIWRSQDVEAVASITH